MRKGYINCELYGHSGASAMLIEDGRIVQIGTDAEIKEKLEETDEVVDIGGLFVVPGFVDSHMHPVILADCTAKISCLPP